MSERGWRLRLGASAEGESIQNGQLQQPLSPATNLQMVAVDDIGAFAVLAFEHPGKWKNRTFSLAVDDYRCSRLPTHSVA